MSASSSTAEHRADNPEVASKRFDSRLAHLTWGQRLGESECPYIRRWVLEVFGYSIRLHHWYRSDDKRAPHDHPYWLLTVVLKGNYDDVSFSEWYHHQQHEKRDRLHPGSIRLRRAEHRHWVERCPRRLLDAAVDRTSEEGLGVLDDTLRRCYAFRSVKPILPKTRAPPV